MTKDEVKRLAIQSGIDLEFFQAGELFSFAAAIAKQAVDEFKAGLVPVAWMNPEGKDMVEVFWVKNQFYSVPLYALPLGETK